MFQERSSQRFVGPRRHKNNVSKNMIFGKNIQPQRISQYTIARKTHLEFPMSIPYVRISLKASSGGVQSVGAIPQWTCSAPAAIPNGLYSTLLNGRQSCKNDNGLPPGQMKYSLLRYIPPLFESLIRKRKERSAIIVHGP